MRNIIGNHLLSLCLATLIFFISPICAANNNTKLVNINVQLKWYHQFQFAGYYAAIEQGYYREHGLNVILHERDGTPTPIETLITGNVDFAVGGAGALVYRENGVPLVALAATFQRSPSILISRYASLAELEDKTIMLSNGVMNAEITALLNKAGISRNEINITPNHKPLTAFTADSVDGFNGYITNEPFYLRKTSVPFFVFDPHDYDIKFYGDVLLTTDVKVQRDKEQVINFRDATLKGWQYAIDNPEEMVEVIIKKYNSRNKTKGQLSYEAEKIIELIHADIVPIGYMNKERWESIIDALVETNHLNSKDVNLDGFILNDEAEQSSWQTVIHYKTELFLFSCVFIGVALFVHNYHLKLAIKEKTYLLNQSKERAEKDARTDVLTGLANRRFFMEMIDHDVSVAKRNNLALSLIYIDVDFFKNINDEYGHDTGDYVLQELAVIFKNIARASDTPARIGGEEFAIVCLEKDQNSAVSLADRIREVVEGKVFSYKEKSFNLTLSFGVTAYLKGETVNNLLKKSDVALYRAKKEGRNTVVCY